MTDSGAQAVPGRLDAARREAAWAKINLTLQVTGRVPTGTTN